MAARILSLFNHNGRVLLLAVCIILSTPIAASAGPSIEGALETGAYFYPARGRSLIATGTSNQYRIYENVSFDAMFDENWFLRFNSRFAYQSQKRDAAGNWIFNFYYGHLDYQGGAFAFQLGRINDFSNLIYLYYDGLNLEANISLSEHTLALDFYGGVIVRDDYLEQERNLYSIHEFNSTDYRSLFLSQRIGDYVAGAKANFFANNIGIFGAEYQVVFNDSSLAEHYASVNIETMFSKKVRLYGYGTLDLVELLPSNTLAAIQINPVDLLSIVVEHEYYRPVFIKDSYWRETFRIYGNQELSASLIFMISKIYILDLSYGLIVYDSTPETGNEIAVTFEDRDFYKFGLKLKAEMIFGPEGNKISLQALAKRRIYLLSLLAGGGVEFFNDTVPAGGYARGYFATLGADLEILKNLMLSAAGEYCASPDFKYDLRGTCSVKYNF